MQFLSALVLAPFFSYSLALLSPSLEEGGVGGQKQPLHSFLQKHSAEQRDALRHAQAEALHRMQTSAKTFFANLNKYFEKLQGPRFDKVRAYKAYREEYLRAFGADEKPFPVREKEDSILVSIGAYRDNELRTTLRDLVSKAEHPHKVFIALVQQACTGRSGPCMSGVLSDGSIKRVEPDEDTEQVFCSEVKFSKWCRTNMRTIKVEEEDSLGPTVARFLASKLWMGETYFMQIDAHVRMAPNWDKLMIQQMKGAPSSRPILSTYPTPSGSRLKTSWVTTPGPRMCVSSFTPEEGDILRLDGSAIIEDVPPARPVPTPWIAAGYFMAPGQFVTDVPFDPLSPWVFMGEELEITARAWTSGYDVFAPNASLITHSYVRRHLPKFWETVGRTFKQGGAHNSLQFYILGRIKYLTGYSEHDPHTKFTALIQPDPDFLYGIQSNQEGGRGRYGLGNTRSLAAFLEHVGVDMKHKTTKTPEYCERRWPSHDDGSWSQAPEKLF